MEKRTKREAALDELIEGKSAEEIAGPGGLLKQLTKTLLERTMNAELTRHLGYEKNAAKGRRSGNSRNGQSRKRVHGDFGQVEIAVPRDRKGSFEPQIRTEARKAIYGFDDKILSIYARGMSTGTESHSRKNDCLGEWIHKLVVVKT